jgi:hypothetical protein
MLEEGYNKGCKGKGARRRASASNIIVTIIGYDYRKTIRYKVDKMTKEVYTRDILPHVLDLKDRGITLCQDADSVYTSKLTQEWVEEHGFSMMTLRGKSPDFSILESMAASLKRRFHYR